MLVESAMKHDGDHLRARLISLGGSGGRMSGHWVSIQKEVRSGSQGFDVDTRFCEELNRHAVNRTRGSEVKNTYGSPIAPPTAGVRVGSCSAVHPYVI